MASQGRSESSRVNGGSAAEAGGPDAVAVAREVAGRAGEMAGEVAGRAGEVAGEVASRLPAAAATTRDAISTAQMRMESTSDEMLTNGTMLSLGVALGLLLGGSNRLLVALALIPAAAMGATLIDRRSRISQ
jgi:hypothetical protein